ncbi:hypothetical protein [Sphingobacterium corticibacter]|nr:hypothetical protein [Sphingobacterium corticibacter]
MKSHLPLAILFLIANFASAQSDSSLDSIAAAHKETFVYEADSFSGNSLDSLLAEINNHQYILIGEQHHTNEVPSFIRYLLQKVNFDNYIMEGNQSVTNLLSETLKKSERDYDDLLERYTDRFGFYTFEKDRELLEYFVLANKPVIELDQVFASSDVPLLDELSKSTMNEKAKAVYQELMNIAEIRWSAYKNNPDVQPPFDLNGLPLLFSEELSTKLHPLLSQEISAKERQIIQDLLQSNAIYTMAIAGRGLQSHEMRISLMKKNLLANQHTLAGKKNLFKFGANHVTKHKSLGQGTPDIGNFALNLADAEGERSLHIAIMEKSGEVGGLFGENVPTDGLPYLKSFTDLCQSPTEWLLFDLNKVNSQIKKKHVNLKSAALINFIDGFDYLIIIPEVSPQSKM